MSQRAEIGATFCLVFCLSLFVLGLAIPTTYYGFAGENDNCQTGTRGGLNLSDWTKGLGLSGFVITGLVYVLLGLGAVTNSSVPIVALVVLLISDLLFWVIWWIWGVVILATGENNHCVADGTGMAVMAIINLVISEVRVTYLTFAIGIMSGKR